MIKEETLLRGSIEELKEYFTNLVDGDKQEMKFLEGHSLDEQFEKITSKGDMGQIYYAEWVRGQTDFEGTTSVRFYLHREWIKIDTPVKYN